MSFIMVYKIYILCICYEHKGNDEFLTETTKKHTITFTSTQHFELQMLQLFVYSNVSRRSLLDCTPSVPERFA